MTLKMTSKTSRHITTAKRGAKRKQVLRMAIFGALVILAALSAEAAKAKKVKGSTTQKEELSTHHSFSGSRVGGEYQVPAEATAKVENEKPLEELLGLRTQFRDRMKQDTERR